MMAKDKFNGLTQTCRTLIVEEFDNDTNGSSPTNLAVLIKNAGNTINLDELHKDLENLVVHSFEEFLEKFCPTVYEECYQTNDGLAFSFSTRKEDIQTPNATQYKISEHEYFKMLETCYTNRRDAGKPNLLIDDSKILSILTPQSVAEKIRDVRRDMKYAYEQYDKAKSLGENADKYAKRIIGYRKKIQNQAKYPIHLLPIAIEDAKTKIKFYEKKIAIKNKKDKDDEDDKKPSFGILELDNEGRLQIGAAPAEPSKGVMTIHENALAENLPAESASNANIVPTIGDRIHDRIAKDVKNIKSDYVRALIVRSYAPIDDKKDNSIDKLSVEELKLDCEKIKAQKAMYERAYSEAQNEFIRVMSQVMEKIMGVRAFFDHATVTGGRSGRLKEGVMISNCTAADLLAVEDTFKDVMIKLASQPGNNELWFAVLPAVYSSELGCVMPGGGDEVDPDGDIYDTDPDIDITKKDTSNHMMKGTDWEETKSFLSIMNEAKIMTVFNFKGNEADGFAAMTKKRVEEYREIVGELQHGEHAVLAYPSFTLLRERKIALDANDGIEGLMEENNPIRYTGVYIDAAYPAAGLLVATQQIDVLKNKNLTIDPNNRCVHVDIEAKPVMKAFQTKFNRENIYNWAQELKSEIAKDMFGFSFCGDSAFPDGVAINNTYVYGARTLSKGKQNYRPVFQILTKDFIERFFRQEGKIDSKRLEEILNITVNNEWKQQAKGHKDIINLMMNEGDTIEVVDRKLKIRFAEDEMVLDNVTIDWGDE